MATPDKLSRLDLRPGAARPLRELFRIWTGEGALTPDEQTRLTLARRDPEFWTLLGPAEGAPVPAPAAEPATLPGSNLTFDASKLGPAEWSEWLSNRRLA